MQDPKKQILSFGIGSIID